MWMLFGLVVVTMLLGGSRVAKIWATGFALFIAFVIVLMYDVQCSKELDDIYSDNWRKICQVTR